LDDFFMEGACGSFPEFDWLSRSPLMQAECKAICVHCPVLAKCRSYGLNKGLDDRGVWGAMTKAERKREVSRRGRRTRSPRRVGVVAEQQGAA
jgi:WhiB family transcriptional regulator, redox-sensing transcriptional regulator